MCGIRWCRQPIGIGKRRRMTRTRTKAKKQQENPVDDPCGGHCGRLIKLARAYHDPRPPHPSPYTPKGSRTTLVRSSERYFKRYKTVVSVSAGSGVGSP